MQKVTIRQNQKNKKKLEKHLAREIKDKSFDIVVLDWFASRVDIYLKNNMLSTDIGLHAILYEWKERVFFNPSMINNCL